MPIASRFKSIIRAILLLCALPGIYEAGASIAFVLRERKANADYAALRLPVESAPYRGERLLVVAPHCDDETLGCGGLMQQTLKDGGDVEVVFLTNGDAFRTAVECMTHRVNVTPADYIKFADLRQRESTRVLEYLGVRPSRILFLGYPDQGSMNIWHSHWLSSSPFMSPYTRCSASPYAVCFHSGAPYSGESIVTDLQKVIEQYRPTLITVTHPSDDHVDHVGAEAFTHTALDLLRLSPDDASWARRIKLQYYLVHHGDWPIPQGIYTKLPLTPPRPLAYLDTHWNELQLTHGQVLKKLHAINMYHSQTAMMGRFLDSFARSTEIFGTLDTQVVTNVTGSLKPNAPAWNMLSPVLLNPQRDGIMRALNGAANISSVYMARNSTSLVIMVKYRDSISAHYRYFVTVRPFGLHGESSMSAINLLYTPGTTHDASGVVFQRSGQSLVIRIPWSLIVRHATGVQPALAGVSASTTIGNVLVDKTGIRIVHFATTPVADGDVHLTAYNSTGRRY